MTLNQGEDVKVEGVVEEGGVAPERLEEVKGLIIERDLTTVTTDELHAVLKDLSGLDYGSERVVLTSVGSLASIHDGGWMY